MGRLASGTGSDPPTPTRHAGSSSRPGRSSSGRSTCTRRRKRLFAPASRTTPRRVYWQRRAARSANSTDGYVRSCGSWTFPHGWQASWPRSLASDGGQPDIGKESPMATVSDDEVLLLWRALSAFRSGAGLGCRPEGSPPRSQCPLVDRCPRWRGPDDRLLSLEETIEETERRRTAWACSRLLDLLGPETRRISR